jgi:hypothetical protein
MNNSKIWILITGIVLMVSGFLLYSTIKAKETERGNFMVKIQELQGKIGDLTKLQADLEQAKKERAEVEAKAQEQISALETQISDYKKNESSLRSKIDTLTKEKESLTKYMENNNVIVGKLQKKIESLEKEKSKIAEEAAKKPDTLMPRFVDPMEEQPQQEQAAEPKVEQGSRLAEEEVVDLGRIILQQATSQPATVEHVNSLYGFIVLSAGTRDGLKKDSIVNITRNNRLIAKAVIKKVREEAASAVTLPEWTREEIRVGDYISVNSPAPNALS